MLSLRRKGRVRFEERCRASQRINDMQTITLLTRIFSERKAALECRNTPKERISEHCVFFQGTSIPDEWNKAGRKQNISVL